MWMLTYLTHATEKLQNCQEEDQGARTEMARVDVDWLQKGELLIAWWAQGTSGHRGKDTTHRRACDRGVILTMDPTAHITHGREACTAVKQAKWLKASLVGQTAASSPRCASPEGFASVLLLLCFHCCKHSPRALAIICESASRNHRIP